MTINKLKKDCNYIQLKNARASYADIIKFYIDDLVLCNNIVEVDDSIWDNIEGVDDLENLEIYQYYLCDLSTYEKNGLLECGCILSYSDMLDCDVLLVDHWGTSWDYVFTDVEINIIDD